MKAKISYSELLSVLGYVNTVLSDKTVEDKMKNVIFLIKEGEAVVVGYSPLTFSRTKVLGVETEGFADGETWDFQVKASELNKIINCYNSLSKTRVENVEFGVEKNKIKVSVHEEAINEEDAGLSQTGVFFLDSIPILASVSTEIHMDFPEESDTVLSADLLLYVDSLYPLMANDSSSSLQSKLNMGEEYVFVMSGKGSTFFANKLPESFQNVTLGYSSVSFLKKLCDNADSIDVQKIDRYLCMQSGNTEAFLKYQAVKVKIDPYVKRLSTENGIVLDRLYLKDVLKRMSVHGADGVAKMTEFGLEVSNAGFSQIIPLANKKGDVDNIKFKLSPSALVKTLVGDDAVFPGQVFLYFVKAGQGYSLYVKDSTNAWFSNVSLRV